MSDIDLLIEECSELIQACCKYKRLMNKDKTLRVDEITVNNMMKEEMVDVIILLTRIGDKFYKDKDEYVDLLNKKIKRTNNLSK